jgi:uncharacterized membrane protein
MSKKCCRGGGNKINNVIKTTLVGLAALGIFVLVFALSEKNSDGGSGLVQGSNNVVTIPLAQLNNGKAHFFRYSSGERDIKFFVLRSSDGVIRAAFDTCDVCYPEKKGYRQEGDFMVCNNCNNKFRSNNINVLKGGCNPVPLDRTVVGNNLVIKVADIKKGEFYF